jgi:hypothetical protein
VIQHDYAPVLGGGLEGRHVLTCVTCGILFCALCGKAISADDREAKRLHAMLACTAIIA